MVLVPETREELARALAGASRARSPVAAVDLSRLSALVEHQPQDMTATAEAGMTLGAFQAVLRGAGQWLPVDPAGPETLSIGDLLAFDRSGPRRFGFGTIRDYLIGLQVALPSGEIIKAGGKVVKNVAGYDLCKLFTGARNSLGIIVEATFKLRPLPEDEVILATAFDSVAALHGAARALLASPVEPVILDAHSLGGRFALVTAFAGAAEDVRYQEQTARQLAPWVASSTEHDRDRPRAAWLSVRPSDTADAIVGLDGARFVARYGNGLIFHDGPPRRPPVVPNPALAARVKAAFDPARILPEYTV